MKSIGIIADTHGYLDPAVLQYFESCDEVWHAGDFGRGVAEALAEFKPLKGVYGNIDGNEIRLTYPENLNFESEELKILMRHIGGSPKHYDPEAKRLIQSIRPDIFITGHSHILKITRDPANNNLLFINSGAAGKSGFHLKRTIVRLKISGRKIFDVEVIELGTRGRR